MILEREVKKMTPYETFCVAFAFAGIVIMMCRTCNVYDKKIETANKTMLELYDRITELENKLNNN